MSKGLFIWQRSCYNGFSHHRKLDAERKVNNVAEEQTTAVQTEEEETLELTEEECRQLSEILDKIISGLEETVRRLDRRHALMQDMIVSLRSGREATHAHR